VGSGALRRRRGVSTRDLSPPFLAVDVERYGVEKVHEFQRRFALELAPASHWAAVFPVPFPDVARDFRRDLERLTE
jgi:hypothetical protein